MVKNIMNKDLDIYYLTHFKEDDIWFFCNANMTAMGQAYDEVSGLETIASIWNPTKSIVLKLNHRSFDDFQKYYTRNL